jgi:hypothetical protein
MQHFAISVVLPSSNDVLVDVLVFEEAADFLDGIFQHAGKHPRFHFYVQLFDVIWNKMKFFVVTLFLGISQWSML